MIGVTNGTHEIDITPPVSGTRPDIPDTRFIAGQLTALTAIVGKIQKQLDAQGVTLAKLADLAERAAPLLDSPAVKFVRAGQRFRNRLPKVTDHE